jgi:hypothetical protein
MLCSVRSWSAWPGIVVVAAVLAACTTGGARPATGHTVASGAGPVVAGPARPFTLYTHCGVDEARIDDRYFEAAHPLSDGAGNPPAGWGNPYQQGTITLLSSSTAVFRDAAGHRVLFRLRPGATSFKHLCD